MDKDLITTETLRTQNPERYLQEVLDVDEFEELKRLVVDSNHYITWEELAEEGVVKIKWRKIEEIRWELDLDLKETKIKNLSKFKVVDGELNIIGLSYSLQIEIMNNILEKRLLIWKGVVFGWNIEWIESLLEEDSIPWDLSLKWTGVKSLWNIKDVYWNLDCRGLDTLESIWELEKVRKDLILVWVKIDLQLKIIKSLLSTSLLVRGERSFGWNIEWIEKLLEEEYIPWVLDMRNSSIELQIEAISKEQKWVLRVDNILVDDIIENLYYMVHNEWKLDIEKFKQVFGGNVNKLEQDMKSLAVEILSNAYKEKKNEIKYKWWIIISNSKRKKLMGGLTDEKKKEIRDKLKELDTELTVMRNKIESFTEPV